MFFFILEKMFVNEKCSLCIGYYRPHAFFYLLMLPIELCHKN